MASPAPSPPSSLPPVPGAGGGTLGEVAALFLKLGTIAFGGPAAHIALMRREVVDRLHWVDDQQFLDLVGAANLIPGPTSTELAIYLGYVRAGWRGLIAAGALFIAPAMVIVLAFAWAYERYGTTAQAGWLLYGVKPVIIAVVVQALRGLGRTAVKGPVFAVVGLAVVALGLVGINPLVLLFGGALVIMLFEAARRRRRIDASAGVAAGMAVLPLPGFAAVAAGGSTPFSLTTLFLTFLKIGAVLYGSGYVLLAFLRDDFVDKLGWLTDQQLIDAVAVGQFTPGPVFTTATFIGYILGGVPGGLLATVAIFLPSFIFVAVVYPLVPRLRRSPWTSSLLDGVNVAAVGLMIAVTIELARAAIIDPLTLLMALVAAALLVKWKINSAWLVLGGGAVGVLAHVVTG